MCLVNSFLPSATNRRTYPVVVTVRIAFTVIGNHWSSIFVCCSVYTAWRQSNTRHGLNWSLAPSVVDSARHTKVWIGLFDNCSLSSRIFNFVGSGEYLLDRIDYIWPQTICFLIFGSGSWQGRSKGKRARSASYWLGLAFSKFQATTAAFLTGAKTMVSSSYASFFVACCFLEEQCRTDFQSTIERYPGSLKF